MGRTLFTFDFIFISLGAHHTYCQRLERTGDQKPRKIDTDCSLTLDNLLKYIDNVYKKKID